MPPDYDVIDQKETPHESPDTTTDTESPTLPPDLTALLGAGLDVTLHLLAHYAELARLLAREILDEEVMHLVVPRYSRKKPHGGRYYRWGSSPGAVQMGEERVPVRVPRVRDVFEERERPLENYWQMCAPIDVDARLCWASRSAATGAWPAPSSTGLVLIQSSVSRRFQERSRAALKAFEERPLE